MVETELDKKSQRFGWRHFIVVVVIGFVLSIPFYPVYIFILALGVEVAKGTSESLFQNIIGIVTTWVLFWAVVSWLVGRTSRKPINRAKANFALICAAASGILQLLVTFLILSLWL